MSWLPMLSAPKPNDRDGDYQCIACPAAEQHQHRHEETLRTRPHEGRPAAPEVGVQRDDDREDLRPELVQAGPSAVSDPTSRCSSTRGLSAAVRPAPPNRLWTVSA